MSDSPRSLKNFLRARRPDEFSDSGTVADQPRIPPALLSHVLENLTADKRELDFETFAYHLVRREACPNLAPQSGPIGGGDSHADAQSYEVSTDLAHRYWFGTASTETRWFAFAFSAKKDWATKLRSDVAKIAAWPRRPDVVGFVTSRQVSDKRKKTLRDEMRKRFGLEVEIFDRAWILAKVAENRSEDLIVQHLHVDLAAPEPSLRLGPNDTRRIEQLDQLKLRLNRPQESYGRSPSFMMAEEYLEAALLSRELERPRNETEGFFAAASRVARDVGDASQQHRVVYQRGWTEIFYFEDLAAACGTFLELEALTAMDSPPSHFEALATLLTPLLAARRTGALGEEHDTAEFLRRLMTLLRSIEASRRPVIVRTRAMCHRAFMEMIAAPEDASIRRRALDEVLRAIESDANVNDLPVRRYVDMALEFLDLEDGSADDDLFERLRRLSAARVSDIDSGRIFLKRGLAALHASRYRSVLRLLAEARLLLWKDETAMEAAQATLVLAAGYESLGLPHAAYLEASFACWQVMRRVRNGPVDRRLALALSELVVAQVAIGALRQARVSVQHLLGVLRSPGAALSRDFIDSLDGRIATALLQQRSDVEASELVEFSEALMDGSAEWPRTVLAGHIAADDLDDFIKGGLDVRSAVQQFAESEPVRDAVVRARAHERLLDEPDIAFVTTIVGLPVVAVANGPRCQHVALALTAVLEAAGGAATRRDLAPWPHKLRIRVERGGDVIKTVRVEPNPVCDWLVTVPDDPADAAVEQEAIRGVLIEMIAKLFLLDEDRLDRVLSKKRGMLRADVLLSALPTASTTEALVRTSTRREPWWARVDAFAAGARGPAATIPPDDEHEPHGGPNLSLISVPQWDAAKWRGVAYAFGLGDEIPELALIFENPDAARDLFAGLRGVLGDVDDAQRLVVAIIDSDSDVSSYHVALAGNVDTAPKEMSTFMAMVRGMRLVLTDPRPRAGFLAAFAKAKRFRLTAAQVVGPAALRSLDDGVICSRLEHGKLDQLPEPHASIFRAGIKDDA